MTTEISRRTMLRGVGFAALAIPTGSFLAACGSGGAPAGGATGGGATGSGAASGGLGEDLLARAKKQGYIRVAIANEPPYTKVEADGTVTGCEPDVCRAVCKKMGIDDIQGIITPYNGMIPGLQANRWDAITAGLFMKQSRCAQVIYSEPVIVSTESFGVPQGNPKHILTVKDVLDNKDLKIVVLPGGFEEGILQTAKVPDSQLVRINDNRSGVEAVLAGRADAFFLPTLSLKALAETEKGLEVTPPVTDAPKTGSGAAFRKDDKAFVDEYNKKLTELKDSDEFGKILDKWGFDPAVVKGVTSKELCENPG